MKKLLASLPIIIAFFSISSPARADILSNQGFENGRSGWDGTSTNYFNYTCGSGNSLSPKDGNCYAYFDDASGTSLHQYNTSQRSGNYQASVAVNGQGSVRFVIWTFCPGVSPQSYGYENGVQLNGGSSWQTLKVKTSSPLNGCGVKWELYIDTDSRVRVDAARLYKTF